MYKLSSHLARYGIAAVALIFLTVSCGKDEQIGKPNPAETAITEITAISNTADRQTLVGRKVDIGNAAVQSVVGTYVFWAGDPRTAVPVVRLDRMAGPVAEHVRPGGKCRITGTVRLLETVSAADRLWDHINEQEKRDLLAARVYIAADAVSVIH